MIREDARVLIEQAGNLVSQVEIKDPSNGCRFKLKLKHGRVIIRVLHSASVQWSFKVRAVLPGHPICESSDKPSVVLLAKLADGLFEAEVPIVITYSLALAVSLRIKSIIGDLVEGRERLRLRFGENNANGWLTKQVAGSIVPVVWQIVRYDVTACLRDWLLWFLPWYLPLWGRGHLEGRSGTVRFTAKAAENIS